ncbi:MAG: hypothetical protein ACPGPS_07950, partial [Rubripirellula sp.]
MSTEQLAERKTEIRKAAHAARKAQADKEQVSIKITDRVMQLPEYQAANCIMWYVDVRDEARTRHALPAALASASQQRPGPARAPTPRALGTVERSRRGDRRHGRG